jgi:NADPH:quinone reductase-like Zn-dependent oxidoreductase
MHAIAIIAFGRLEQLHLVDLPVPTAGPNEVLIQVKAMGIAGSIPRPSSPGSLCDRLCWLY